MMSGQAEPNDKTLTISAEQTEPVEWIGDFKTRWHMQRLLGRGGQSEVWLAHDNQLRESVAVKVFSPRLSADEMTRLRREVRIGRSLRHSGLVRIYELIESTHGLALVMEWLPGGSLAQRLEAGLLPLCMVIRATEQTLAALAFLHGQGVVHRDIKPSNLLLDADEQVHVADLGLLKPIGEGHDQTETCGAAGTPLYMSPEQIRSQPLTPATDLYSLGATLYHLVTGEPPFSGQSTYAIAQQHIKRSVVDPRRRRSDCPGWLARFVMRLLEKSPADRWPDAGAAAQAFHRRQLCVSPRFWRRLMALLAAGILAAVVAAALIRAWSTGAFATTSIFSAEDRVVRGLDHNGEESWRFTCSHPIQQLIEIDLDGDNRKEVLVSAFPRGSSVRGRSDYQSEIVALDVRGRLITRFLPEDKVKVSRDQRRPPMFFSPILEGIDLNGDGITEVVANCRHRGLAPTYLFVFWPEFRRWEPLLDHDGWIFDIRGVPGYANPRLRFLAFNNTLAALPAVAELELTAPTETNRPADVWRHPGAIAGANPVSWADFVWYTPLPQAPPGSFDAVPPFVVDDRATSIVSMAGQLWTIERWGNPVPGPNVGRNLESLRIRFLQRLNNIGGYRELTNPDSTKAAISEMESEFAPLLAEEPYRAVLAESAAKALARSGDPAAGIKFLQQEWQEIPYDSLGHGLANLQSLVGDLNGAVATLERTIERGQTPAGGFRSMNLLIRVAIEMHDQRLFAAASDSLTVEAGHAKPAAIARANLWWDQVEPADCRLESLDVTPDAEAIACLARWRRGQVTEHDLTDMDEALVRNPDAEDDVRLARAAVLLGLSREDEALVALEELSRRLERQAKNDFLKLQTATLAQAIEVLSLARAGRKIEAKNRADRFSTRLRPGLLPAILVNEALNNKADSVRVEVVGDG